MIGELCALGAALSWGGGSIILKPLTARFHPLSLNALRNMAAWLFLLMAMLFSANIADFRFIPTSSLMYILGSGVIGLVIGSTLYIKSLSLANIALIYPVSYSSWLLFTALIAALFFEEPVTWLTMLGAGLIIVGIILLSTPPKKVKVSINILGLSCALLAGFCWAIGTIFLKVGLREVNPLTANFVRLPIVFLLLTALTFKQRNNLELSKHGTQSLVQVGVSGILDQGCGAVLWFVAIQLSGAAKATILSSTSPLFVMPLSILFLREKITLPILLGTLLCVFGIWLII